MHCLPIVTKHALSRIHLSYCHTACQVGDVVQAKYQPNGRMYDAQIAAIDGGTITVNWDDGDPNHRDIASKDVFKDGSSCQLLAGI